MEMLTTLFGDRLSIFGTENMFVLYRLTLLESCSNKRVSISSVSVTFILLYEQILVFHLSYLDSLTNLYTCIQYT